MDIIKKLTGKNPTEYEVVAKSLVDNSDVELFAKLVKQDDFLFDFIKDNVAKRIQSACNKDNYLNLLAFLKYYSPSYDTMIARVLYSFSGDELLPEMKELFLNGTEAEKAYAVKYFSFVQQEFLSDMLPLLRKTSKSDFEPLAMNSIEVLSLLKDEVSKAEALSNLESLDEFVKFDAVKFLVTYQAKDCLDKIVETMKYSTFAENIAAEIPYLLSFEDMFQQDSDSALLVLCNIINAIPEIIPISSVCDFCLYEVFNKLINEQLTSTVAVALRLAKDKFEELCSNDEYLFDADKNTKDEVQEINELLKKVNTKKLESFFYDELYDESDFVFFALDFVSEIEELETLLDSNNETLILKVLTLLKEKSSMTSEHKNLALQKVFSPNIRSVVEVL
ncbi:MAG: hypothetical protein E7Z92_02060 [Cyanobacteria bacterium SIG31]|nr:hypothetical protein [Cyanobacteria bacterium SIG31]